MADPSLPLLSSPPTLEAPSPSFAEALPGFLKGFPSSVPTLSTLEVAPGETIKQRGKGLVNVPLSLLLPQRGFFFKSFIVSADAEKHRGLRGLL